MLQARTAVVLGRWRSRKSSGESVSPGTELFCLCHTATSDGTLTAKDAERLSTWLARSAGVEVPARAYVEGVVRHILDTGKVTPADLAALARALEPCLPPVLKRRRAALRAVSGARPGVPDEAHPTERNRNAVLDSACFLMADAHPDVLARGARSGAPVLLVRERSGARSPHCIQVCTSQGKVLGFVPEQRARALAPLLDRGARYRAHVISADQGAQAPVVIVQAFLYRSDAVLGLTTSAARRVAPGVLGSRAAWMLVRLAVALAIAAGVALVLRS